MEKYVIALAGGPASGKSSVLRALKNMKTSEEVKVLFLDETATVFLHNRPEEVSRRDDPLLRQHYILNGQRHAERLLLENCTDPERPTLLITDRGSTPSFICLTRILSFSRPICSRFTAGILTPSSLRARR